MSPTKTRGLSLIEAMVALALLALVMGLIGGLLRGYTRVMKKAETRDHSVEALHTLRRIQSEVRESQTRPESGEVLRFSKVSPTVPFPSSFEHSERIYPSQDLTEIEIKLEPGTTLVRLAGGSQRILMEEVGNFSVLSSDGDGLLEISLSVLERDGLVLTHQANVYLPAVVP